jgi:hypothetical protein
MEKIYTSFIVLIFFSCSKLLNAQILSVAPGTDFNVKAGVELVADRVDFSFSGDFTFTNNTLNVDLVPNTIPDISTIQRIYRFTNSVNYMPARLSLNYLQSELNGIAELELEFLYNNGKGWVYDINNGLNTAINLLQGRSMQHTTFNAFTAGKYLVTEDLIEVQAYPNPSVTEFNVMVLAKGQFEIEITCMNILGQIIERHDIRPYQQLKVGHNFPKGTYIIRAVQGNKPIAAIRVVKL